MHGLQTMIKDNTSRAVQLAVADALVVDPDLSYEEAMEKVTMYRSLDLRGRESLRISYDSLHTAFDAIDQEESNVT